MKALLTVLTLLLLSLAPNATSFDAADLVFINGNIYTVNAKQPHSEAVVVKGDRIVFVGANATLKKYEGANTRIVDLHGSTMVPGMTDAHYHFIGVGQREMNLNLEGITNLEDFLAKVKARVDKAKPGEWVTGRGWIETFWKPPVFPTRWDLDKKVYGEGKLKLRIYKAVYGPGPEAQRLLREGPIIEAFGDRLNLRTIKVVSDGALGSRGAALLEPYSDAPDSKGFLRVKEEDLLPMLKEALQKGIQVQTHAIGDYANRFILDEYEKALNAVPKSERKIAEPRWRDEHSQIVNPIDIPRFAKLGIIPSMQASHAIGDLHFAPSRLGMKRLEGAYAWQSFIKSGVIVPGGSDAPVERGEPMIEFYAAVARKDIRGFSGEGWHPEEKVTREQALKMLTIWPAHAAFQENVRGSIEVGKLADLTVLSADIMKIPELEILKTHCLMTVIGGEIVYDTAGGAAGIETDFNNLPTTDLWWRSDVDDE